MALICDTGPVYAAMDTADGDHAACAELFRNNREAIIVPAPVVVEVDWLASRRLPTSAIDAFLADIENGTVRVAELVRADYRRIRELCSIYADLHLGFVDAAVAAVTERLRESKLATLDHRHFRVIRLAHVPALRLLPD